MDLCVHILHDEKIYKSDIQYYGLGTISDGSSPWQVRERGNCSPGFLVDKLFVASQFVWE